MPLAILGLLPAIPHIILGIEKMFGHGGGTTKKQAAMNAIADIFNIASTTQGSPGADSSMMAFIDDLIEVTVKYLNNSGTMVHGNENGKVT